MISTEFHSRALNSAEKNYSTHDKEMLAIMNCLKKFESQLTESKFNILMNHAFLIHWKTQKNLSARQIRWNETLSHFDVDIHHIPGIFNSTIDVLSCYSYIQFLENLLACVVSIIEFNEIILKNIKKSYKNNHLFKLIIKNPEWYPLFQFEKRLLFFEERFYIPINDRTSRKKLLRTHHDHTKNHHTIDKTWKSIIMNYYWLEIQ